MWSLLERLGFAGGRRLDELCRRLGVEPRELLAVRAEYDEFAIAKRSGGKRIIHAPQPALKAMQRRILRRLLARLRAHPAATGFERGHSIVTNALPHVARAVVIHMDVRDFFPSTTARRVRAYFRRLGWGRWAAAELTRLCTHRGRLPQGAPTSPRLSNLLNYRLDARLERIAHRFGAAYTRYADDLTFSFERDEPERIRQVIRCAKSVLRACGYRHHRRRKLHIRRQHQCQMVTGLVVNQRPALPRAVRRRLRAIEHRLRSGRAATLTEAQMEGWRALRGMIRAQAGQ